MKRCKKAEGESTFKSFTAERESSFNSFTLYSTLPSRADVLMGCTWPPFTTVPHLHLHVISPASQITGLSKYIAMTPWFVQPEYVTERLERIKTG